MANSINEIHVNVDFNKKSKFTGANVESGLPVACPLDNLDDLLSWKADDCHDPGQSFSISNVPYLRKEIPKGSTKTLVCHDMQGGYVDDRFVQGTVCKDDKWYYLLYWDIIDTFVYFSHHFVTIPPVGWINCAHRNGVAVLGTFITEWLTGKKRCKVIFSNEFLWKLVADKLVEIAKYYKFEGWLINIENPILGTQIAEVAKFVKYLTDKMRCEVDGSQVIWYDSVTKDGKLIWQNALNSENEEFFNACDGIFLNYAWSEVTLEQSATLASKLSRVQDVYVGVDVFGRGCYGGGGFNTALALKVIRRHNLSAAIFAPGWVKEALGSKDFDKNQEKFWTSLAPFCNQHAVAFTDKNFLSTDFSTGTSLCAYTNQCDRFLDLSMQQTMPNLSRNNCLSLTENCHALVIDAELTADVFSTRFVVRPGEYLALYMRADMSKLTSVFLETSIGQCILTYKDFCDGEFYVSSAGDSGQRLWMIESQKEFTSNRICCQSSKVPSKLYYLTCSVNNSSISVKEYLPKMETPTAQPLLVNAEDITWKKDPHSSNLLMSCMLDLGKSSADRTQIYYLTTTKDSTNDFTKSSAFKMMGSSFSGKYRVNDLSVPNPVYDGPETRLVFKVCSWVKSNPNFKLFVGYLVIDYAENTNPDSPKQSH